VLRGGRARPNYDPESIAEACISLSKHQLANVLMVDCSHANSLKQHARQEDVWISLIEQRAAGTRCIIGAMVESYLKEGNQPMLDDPTKLIYGVSVTDSCLSWEATERMLRHGHSALAQVSRKSDVKPAQAMVTADARPA
jgi:3-deoxy-7-phosphoheptulonate synthase